MAPLHITGGCPCKHASKGAFGSHLFHSNRSLRSRHYVTGAKLPRKQTQLRHRTSCTAAQPGLDAGAYDSPQRETRITPASTEGRDVYRPQSFKEITEDAVKSVLAAIEQGHKRLEVEFPPIPSSESKEP